MKPEIKHTIRKIMIGTMWASVGTALVVLLVAAVRSRDKQSCQGIDVRITGTRNIIFIDKTDILHIISGKAGEHITGRPISEFDLCALENVIRKDVWVKNAQLFFDNNNILKVLVEEREPVARIFTSGGETFYIDSEVTRLPLSDKLSADVPVFTNFPNNGKGFSKPDSQLLRDIRDISMRISSDAFLKSLIDQVDISQRRYFEMIPMMGDQVIKFGNADNAGSKFEKLELFYKKIMPKVGWGKYSIINLQFDNQVVAKIRGKDDVAEDSLRTLQMMDIIAAHAAAMAEDSIRQSQMRENSESDNTNENMIQESIQREDEPDDKSMIISGKTEPSSRSLAPLKPQENQPKPGAEKSTVKKPPAGKVPAPVVKPVHGAAKAIMPKSNDY